MSFKIHFSLPKINLPKISLPSIGVSAGKDTSPVATKGWSTTVSRVLDPDLAVPEYASQQLITTLGLKGLPIPVGVGRAVPKHGKGRSAHYSKALGYVVDEISKFLDLIRLGDLITKAQDARNQYKKIAPTLTTSEFLGLPAIGQFFYIPADAAMTQDRYKSVTSYAGMGIPPIGRFSPIGNLLTEKKSVTTEPIRGKGTTSSPVGYRGLLARLRDGSLLEFYTTGTALSSQDVESMMNMIISQEPSIAKKFILSTVLSVELGRPAYNLDELHTYLGVIDSASPQLRQEFIETLQTTGEGVTSLQKPGKVVQILETSPQNIFIDSKSEYADWATTNQKRIAAKHPGLANQIKVLVDKLNLTAFGLGTEMYLSPIIAEDILDDYAANTVKGNVKTLIDKIVGINNQRVMQVPRESLGFGIVARMAYEEQKQVAIEDLAAEISQTYA